jgi:hypothetical protein
VQACLLACCADVAQVQVVMAGVAVVCICSAGLRHSVGVVPAFLADPCCPWCITPALHIVCRPCLCGGVDPAAPLLKVLCMGLLMLPW